MKKRIVWPRIDAFDPDRAFSPFDQPKGSFKRPLTITLDSQRLQDLSSEEAGALNIVLETDSFREIDVISTDKQHHSVLDVKGFFEKPTDPYYEVFNSDGTSILGAFFSYENLLQSAKRFAKRIEKYAISEQEAIEQYIIARAHINLHRDVFVVSTPYLVSDSKSQTIPRLNALLPSEAAKLVGVFLRSRGHYLYSPFPHATYKSSRRLYYWFMARYQMPNNWEFFSACVYSNQVRSDNILDLGQSVLVRCARALQARDQIGLQFYSTYSQDAAELMMYHFDYLLILLVGAFDALARIIFRVYQLGSQNKEKMASFNRWASQKDSSPIVLSLRQANYELFKVVTDERSRDLYKLLFRPRHTIHEAHIQTITYHEVGNEEETYAKFSNPLANIVEPATRALGEPNDWGLMFDDFGKMLFEPYSYACRLVDESLNFLDRVMGTTDFKRLFNNHPIPSEFWNSHPTSATSRDSYFSKWAQTQIKVLG